MAETEPESESVRADLGYKPGNPESTERIKELLKQPRDPEAGLPTTKEAAKYGLPNIEAIRRKIRKMPDNPPQP